jgi:hypothetical protein
MVLCVAGGSVRAQPQAPRPAAPVSGSQPEATPDRPELNRLLSWLESVRSHRPGSGDPPAVAVSGWPAGAFDTLVKDIDRLSAFLERTRTASSAWRPPTIRVHGRRFTRDEVAAVFDGNGTLMRGAVLHADIAVFVGGVPDDADVGATDPGHVIVEDGRRRGGVRHGNLHWQIGRRLLDAMTPGPGTDAGARLWYRAVSAYLLRASRLAEAYAHLQRARRVFADDPSVLLDSAYLHQIFSPPAIQAAAAQLRAGGANVSVDSRRAELERAERFFRQALAVAPDDAGARLRFGHTLGALGRHEEAAAELRAALGAALDEPQRYLAELFLGREEQALGRLDEARQRYENAAALYPRAQSPRLASSQLARQSGDRAGALEALHGVTVLPPFSAVRYDPWWDYYKVHAQDAGDLMARMRALADQDRP